MQTECYRDRVTKWHSGRHKVRLVTQTGITEDRESKVKN